MWRVLSLTILLLAAPALAQDDQQAEEPATETEQVAPQPDPFELDPFVAFEAFLAGNFARAFDLAVTFANRGDAPAMRLLGQMYAGGFGVDVDQAEAFEWYSLASDNGDLEAKVSMATMLLDGAFVERDENQAAGLLRTASDGGNVAAKQMLAMLHLEGRGVARDINRGAQLMREAAEAGDITAQYTLGILYAEGAGVRQDTAQSYEWFETAARRGNVEAQIELAIGLLSGDAGDADMTQQRRVDDAIFWFRRAAEAGNPVAENRLAHAYSQGFGVPLDPVIAAYYHARAVAGGLADARLDSFVSSLPEEQRLEAQARLAAEREAGSPN